MSPILLASFSVPCVRLTFFHPARPLLLSAVRGVHRGSPLRHGRGVVRRLRRRAAHHLLLLLLLREQGRRLLAVLLLHLPVVSCHPHHSDNVTTSAPMHDSDIPRHDFLFCFIERKISASGT